MFVNIAGEKVGADVDLLYVIGDSYTLVEHKSGAVPGGKRAIKVRVDIVWLTCTQMLKPSCSNPSLRFL